MAPAERRASERIRAWLSSEDASCQISEVAASEGKSAP
jgi:phage terminase large subunit-like protein